MNAARTRWLWFAALLAACSVGPDYEQPVVAAEPRWQGTGETGVAAGAPILEDWWTSFGDARLDELVQLAVARNHDLRVATARVREARAARRRTAAAQLPSLDAAAAYRGFELSENGAATRNLPPGSDFDGELTAVGFDFAWEIDVFGAVRRSVEAADAELAVTLEQRRDVLLSVVAELAREYAELRGLQRRLSIAERNLAIQRETLGLTRALRTGGQATDIDVLRADTLLAQTEAAVPPLHAGIRQGMFRLALLLGETPGALVDRLGEPAPALEAPPRVPVGLPSQLVQRRADVRAAERELAAATARVGVATADLFPRFFLTGAAGYESVGSRELVDAHSGFWTLGPSLRWPLFSGGRIRAQIAASSAQADAAAAHYEQAVLRAFAETESALVGFGREQQRRDQLARSRGAADDAVGLAQQRYRNGLESFQTVLDAQRTLFEVEDLLVTSQTAVAVRLIAVHKALGGGFAAAGAGPPALASGAP